MNNDVNLSTTNDIILGIQKHSDTGNKYCSLISPCLTSCCTLNLCTSLSFNFGYGGSTFTNNQAHSVIWNVNYNASLCQNIPWIWKGRQIICSFTKSMRTAILVLLWKAFVFRRNPKPLSSNAHIDKLLRMKNLKRWNRCKRDIGSQSDRRTKSRATPIFAVVMQL